MNSDQASVSPLSRQPMYQKACEAEFVTDPAKRSHAPDIANDCAEAAKDITNVHSQSIFNDIFFFN
jgi:hypothetical protein